MAASTKAVGFLRVHFTFPQQVGAPPGTHYSWEAGANSPINTAGSTGAMQVKFLAQGNNSKQLCLGIEPGSVGSQADPKPLKPQLP